MRFALIVMLDSDDEPERLVKETISTLEFDHRSSVRYAVVLTDDGQEVYDFKFKEEHP